MTTAQNNAPDLCSHGAQENVHPHSASAAKRDQQDKSVQTLRARAALGGFALHILCNGTGEAHYLISRWNLSRTMPDLAAVDTFLTQAGVRHA